MAIPSVERLAPQHWASASEAVWVQIRPALDPCTLAQAHLTESASAGRMRRSAWSWSACTTRRDGGTPLAAQGPRLLASLVLDTDAPTTSLGRRMPVSCRARSAGTAAWSCLLMAAAFHSVQLRGGGRREAMIGGGQRMVTARQPPAAAGGETTPTAPDSGPQRGQAQFYPSAAAVTEISDRDPGQRPSRALHERTDGMPYPGWWWW